MAGKTISQFIRLEGAEEIRRLLEQIGQAGSKAFEQVKTAASDATKNLEGISKAVANTQAQFARMAQEGRKFGAEVSNLGGAANNFGSAVGSMTARVVALTTVVAATGGALVAFGVNAVKAVDNLGETAAALGLSTDAYQKLRFAAVQAGVSQEQFSTALARFSKTIEEAATDQSKALLQFADATGKTMKQAGVHVIEVGRDFAREFKVIGEAAVRLQQQLREQGIERPLFRIREELQALANGGAETRKRFEELTGHALPSMNEGLDRLRTAASGGGNALRQLGISVRDSAGQIRPIEDILGDVAEKFKALPEGAQRTALALRLFGRSGAQMGAFLAQGRAGIQETIKELERLGILLSKEEVEAADKAANAFDLLGLAAQNLRLKLGLVFAGPLREGAAALTKLIAENSAALQKFASDVAGKVVPIMRDLIRLLSGKESEIENKWILDARDAFIAFAVAVQGAINNIIIPAFNVLRSVLQTVADGINAVFGTKLTGGQVGIAIVVAQLIGAFTVLGTGILVVVAAVKALAVGLSLIVAGFTLISSAVTAVATVIAGLVSWPALIVVGLIAAAAAIVVFWDDIKKGALALWDYVKDLFSKPFDDAWKWVADTFDGAIEKLKKKAHDAIDFIKNLLTSAADKTGASVPQGVPLLGGQSPFDRLPESQNIEDRRGETQSQLQQLEDDGRAMLTRLADFIAQVGEQVTGALGTMVTAAQQAAQNFISAFVGAGDLIGQLIAGGVQRASDASTDLIAQVATAVQQMTDALASAVNSVIAGVDASIAAVISRLEEAVRRAQELAAAAAAAAAAATAGGGGGGPGFAFGGYTGAGRTRIAGVVHGEEYVQPAWVVAQPGVLAFMEMLRRTGGDLQGVIARFTRGFADGGFVTRLRAGLTSVPIPGFADGGFVPAPAAIPHLGTIDMRMDGGTARLTVVMNDAVKQVQRMNVRRQLSRIGKPARGT